MKITLARSGGIAAAIRRPAKVLDSVALSAQDAEELARLVAAAGQPSPQPKAPSRVRDGINYSITIDQNVLTQSDGSMSPAFTALLECLEKHFAGKK